MDFMVLIYNGSYLLLHKHFHAVEIVVVVGNVLLYYIVPHCNYIVLYTILGDL